MALPGYEIVTVNHTASTSGLVHVDAPTGKLALGAGWSPGSSAAGNVTALYPDTDGGGWSFQANAFGGSVDVNLHLVVASETESDPALAALDARVTNGGAVLAGTA